MGKGKKKQKIKNKKPKEENSIKSNPTQAINESSKEPGIIFLTCAVKPNARTDRIYFDGDLLCIDISSPPVKGKANTAIIKFLGNVLNISKSNITLERGHTSSTKMFRIDTRNEKLAIEQIKSKIKESG